jgi:DDE superfamily endonuclease
MHFHGPVPGSKHDTNMLHQSKLLNQLKEIPPKGMVQIYGDPAYPQNRWIFGGFRKPLYRSPEQKFNTRMSRVRQAVEWGFNDIVSQFKFLDMRLQMKLYQQPIAAYYYVGAFLCNLCNCFYPNQTSQYFDIPTLDIQEYLDMIET